MPTDAFHAGRVEAKGTDKQWQSPLYDAFHAGRVEAKSARFNSEHPAGTTHSTQDVSR
mgnify:CR=1 FL=1